jgi:hypothetical protein
MNCVSNRGHRKALQQMNLNKPVQAVFDGHPDSCWIEAQDGHVL